MDIEFHYYITYLLALKSGFSTSESYIIAYSSQFVDDNKQIIKVIDNKMNLVYSSTPTQIQLFSSAEKRDLILQKHHFLPGELGLLTTPNSKKAQSVIKNALNKGNFYLIGIATHAYVDTWAHQNFVGGKSDLNSIPGWDNKIIPNIGHADAFDDPDALDAYWVDLRRPELGIIVNSDRFLDAAKNLYSLYYISINKNEPKDLEKLTNELKYIFNTHRSKFRLGRRSMMKKRNILYNELAKSTSGLNIPKYNEETWMENALKPFKENQIGEKKYKWKDSSNFEKTDWWKFNEAAKEFQAQN